ncbi:kelch-like protein 9 isoform X2 [Clavelina lepadiformis]|uniref:kelch-like protein 9 isoform X2 n=1 Tax=Clavelina lepadiformis TaxID=159417 RepID=UPI0040437459
MSGLIPKRSVSGSVAGSLGRRPEYQVYKSNTHNNSVLNGLNDLRQDKILCDVTLIAEEHPFYAHKNVLASCSPYLRNLFNTEDGMKTEHEVVEIRGVSAEGLRHVIGFIYTSELQLSIKNVRCILAAAGHMQLKPILNFCKAFLIAEISVYNCVDIIHIAEKYTLNGVEEKCYNFIAEHLNELVKTEEIQKLTIDNVSLLLDSYALKNVSELELFEASRQWLLYQQDRYQHVRQLMEKIHFPLIPPRDLLRYVNFVEFMRVECNFLLLEASNYHMLPHSQPILQSIRTQVRSNDSRLVIIGGVDPHDRVSNQLFAINGDMSKSDFLPPMHEGLCSHCSCVLNNFLYVLGGQNMFDERGTTAVNTVIRYDPRFNIWMRIASMNDRRAGFTCSVVDNRLYALGGVNATGRMSSMECYSLEDDRWRYVASVQTGLCDHAQAVHGNLIYISGGFKEGRFNNQLLAYSPRHDTWHERTPMHFARGWHAMVAFGDSIFVTGGNAGLNKRIDIHETEIYNAMSDQWTLVAPLPLPHSEGGSEYYDGKLYVVGGYSWTQQKCLSSIQCYDPNKDSWENHGNLPIELSGVRLSTLTIPYTISPRSGLTTGSHVPLSWPSRQMPSQLMEQDPRMMMGNALFNTGGQPQMLSGYMDPFAMTDMQDAMGEYAQPNSKFSAGPSLGSMTHMGSMGRYGTPKEFRAAVSRDIPSDGGKGFRIESQEAGGIYSHPRSTSIDETSSMMSRTPSAFSKDLDTDIHSETTSISSGLKKNASFRESVEDSSSESSDDDIKSTPSSIIQTTKREAADEEIRAYR